MVEAITKALSKAKISFNLDYHHWGVLINVLDAKHINNIMVHKYTQKVYINYNEREVYVNDLINYIMEVEK